jgi:glycosyltransferase involved in cell wall biosynthesis
MVMEKTWDKLDDLPLISIGMPIYNSEDTLENAILSIINQDYKNIELIISDNSSTDKTEEICRRFANYDSRVKYVRQNFNIGPTANFEYVLANSSGKYFMWAAGDDSRSSRFISVNLAALSENPNIVASTSPNIFDKDSRLIENEVRISLLGNRASRFKQFLNNPHQTHGLFYSLIRIESIRSCPWIREIIFGWDWAIVLYLANQGEINRTNSELIIFGTAGYSRQNNIYLAHGLSGFKRIIPYSIFSKRVLSLIRPWPKNESFPIFFKVIWLNLKTLLLEYRLIRYFLGDVKKMIKVRLKTLFGSGL